MAKNLQSAQQDFENAGLSRTQRYKDGTSGKGSKWASGAAAGENNFKAGVIAAANAGAYGKGVSRAGGSAYDNGVSTKGVNNWPTGMQQGGNKWAKNVQPFTSLWSAPLSTPRGPKRSAANMARMTDNANRFATAKNK